MLHISYFLQCSKLSYTTKIKHTCANTRAWERTDGFYHALWIVGCSVLYYSFVKYLIFCSQRWNWQRKNFLSYLQPCCHLLLNIDAAHWLRKRRLQSHGKEHGPGHQKASGLEFQSSSFLLTLHGTLGKALEFSKAVKQEWWDTLELKWEINEGIAASSRGLSTKQCIWVESESESRGGREHKILEKYLIGGRCGSTTSVIPALWAAKEKILSGAQSGKFSNLTRPYLKIKNKKMNQGCS